jgi:hypothetical protein
LKIHFLTEMSLKNGLYGTETVYNHDV